MSLDENNQNWKDWIFHFVWIYECAVLHFSLSLKEGINIFLWVTTSLKKNSLSEQCFSIFTVNGFPIWPFSKQAAAKEFISIVLFEQSLGFLVLFRINVLKPSHQVFSLANISTTNGRYSNLYSLKMCISLDGCNVKRCSFGSISVILIWRYIT